MTKTQEDTKVQSMVPKAAQELYDRIIKTDGVIDDSFVTLAEALYQFDANNYPEKFGFATLDDFLEAQIKIGKRKGRYLISIWAFVKENAIPLTDVKKIGWSKMREIAAVATEKNYKEWMHKAATSSHADLIKEIKRHKSPNAGNGEGGETESTTKFTFSVSTDESTVITDALSVMKTLGVKTDSEALMAICQEWMENKGQSPVLTPLENMIRYVNEMYGVSISVGDGDQTSIVETVVKEPVKIDDKIAEPERANKSAGRTKVKSEKKSGKKGKKSGKKEEEATVEDGDDVENVIEDPAAELDAIIGNEKPFDESVFGGETGGMSNAEDEDDELLRLLKG